MLRLVAGVPLKGEPAGSRAEGESPQQHHRPRVGVIELGLHLVRTQLGSNRDLPSGQGEHQLPLSPPVPCGHARRSEAG